MPYRLLGFWLLAGLSVLGCSKSQEEAPTTKTPAPLEGRWLLTITQDSQEHHPGDYRDFSTVLLDIKHIDGEYQAEVKGSKPALPRAKLKRFEVKEDQVHVVLLCDQYTFDFVGRFDGTKVKGTMDQGGFIIEPSALVKTEVQEVSQADEFYLPTAYAAYQKVRHEAVQDTSQAGVLIKNFESFRKFSEEHSESPLAVIMYHALVEVLPHKAKDEAEAKEFAKAYLKIAGAWGERMKALAQFNLGSSLAREPQFAELGLKYLSETETQLDADKQKDVREQLNYYREMAESSQVRQKAETAFSDVKAGRKGGMESLRKLNEQTPFDPLVMFYRAEAARITGQTDEALKYYAQVAVWPRLQSALQAERVWQTGERKLPEGRMLELWVKKHGSNEGIEDYKREIYDEALNLIARQTGGPESAPSGNRVSVMELFTGTNCPPCLGADLATSVLEKFYSPSKLVVLRYHVHTNGLDPLANPRNLDRFDALVGTTQEYQTPSVFINGKPAASSVTGFLEQAADIAKSLNGEVQPFLEDQTPLTFKLSAYEHEGEISISSNLTGIPDAKRHDLRVLLLLAERELEFPAPNGIRKHEMLVRWLFQDGISFPVPNSGDFQFEAKLAVKDIRNLLESSTHEYARQLKQEVKSIPLDLKGLSLVALVHDGESREILQAAIVPVEVYDTKPMLPTLPMPKLPTMNPPATGPMLLAPNSETAPAKAEKPRE